MNKISFIGNGVNKLFNISFPFYRNNDLVIKVDDEEKNLNQDYKVVGTPKTALQNQGAIEFFTAPAQGAIIDVIRFTEQTRLTDFESQARFEPEYLDLEFNNQQRQIQDLNGELNRVESESKERDAELQINIDQVDDKQSGWNNKQDNRLDALESSVTAESRYVQWVYMGKGGETVIKVPYKFTSINAVYINGVRQSYGKDKAYTYSTVDYTIILSETLEQGDEVLVTVGREAQETAPSEFDGSVPVPEPRQYGDGVTTRFKAPHTAPADANAFFVYIDGVKQSAEAGDYSVPAVLALDFSEAPPVGAAIDITYFRPIPNDGLLVKSFESESVFMIRVNDAGVISTVKQ